MFVLFGLVLVRFVNAGGVGYNVYELELKEGEEGRIQYTVSNILNTYGLLCEIKLESKIRK